MVAGVIGLNAESVGEFRRGRVDTVTVIVKRRPISAYRTWRNASVGQFDSIFGEQREI